jgi:hypothetical protein
MTLPIERQEFNEAQAAEWRLGDLRHVLVIVILYGVRLIADIDKAVPGNTHGLWVMAAAVGSWNSTAKIFEAGVRGSRLI